MIILNPKHLSLGYDSAWNLEKWENSQWIILDKKKHTNYFAELPFLAAYMTGGPEFSLTFFRIINEYEMYRDLVPLPSGRCV